MTRKSQEGSASVRTQRMAKKHDKIKADRNRTSPDQGHRFRRYCYICLLTGVVVLAWLSLLTFSPKDPPSHLRDLPPGAIKNSAGIVGSYFAFGLRYWMGSWGVYVALSFTTVAACFLLLGRTIKDLSWRAIGVVTLMISASTVAYLASGNTDPITGPAGIIGRTLGHSLLDTLRPPGAWLVLAVALGIGALLAADNIVLALPNFVRRMWKHTSEQLPITAFRWPWKRLATAEASGATGPAATMSSPRNGKADKSSAASIKDSKQAAPDAKSAADKSSRTEPSPAASPARHDAAEAAPLQPKAIVKLSPQPKPQPAEEKSKGASVKDKGTLFSIPSANLLAEPSGGYAQSQEAQAEQKRVILQQTLTDFGVAAQVIGHQTGPVITLFELSLAPGVKVAQVANLAIDIARALAVPGVRVFSPIEGKDTMGIEVPNLQKEIVRIKELMRIKPDAQKTQALPLYLGKDAGGDAIVADLAKMPHMLIAGTTGSGKSVCINTIIMSLLLTRTPEDVRFILVDPKMVEMAAFENISHLLCPVVNDMKRAEDILEWAAAKMDERYDLLKEAGVKNIAGFNALGKDEVFKRFQIEDEEEKLRFPTRLPYYVVIIDELADLIMTSSKEVEGHIIRIAQKARAVGIHLILATQRPSVNVVTGLIKSNMPCRISFRVASRQESRIVLDQNGAEVLLGQGDMLMLQPGTSYLLRAQGTYVDDGEVRTVVEALRAAGPPQYSAEVMRLGSPTVEGDGGGERDELFDKAVEVVLTQQRGSVSLLQRRLQIGYSRSSRIIDQMADAGILGDYKGSQARECLMTLEDWQVFKSSVAADQSGRSSANGEPTSS